MFMCHVPVAKLVDDGWLQRAMGVVRAVTLSPSYASYPTGPQSINQFGGHF